MIGRLAALTSLSVLASVPLGTARGADASESRFLSLYKELVETNTTLSSGSCTLAAERMRARLLQAGYTNGDVQILVPPNLPRSGDLIATLPGSDLKLKPILLLAHIDVVEAKAADWKRDPLKLVEDRGVYYARGSSDDKAMASSFTDAMIRYREEGFRPKRTIRLSLTCGEETSRETDGVAWLLSAHPDLLDAEFALNEGAHGQYDENGKPKTLEVQAGEKVYTDFELTLNDPGGHSSRPRYEGTAIVRMSQALAKLGAYEFPISINDTTRRYFQTEALHAAPDVARDMRAILAAPPDNEAAARLWRANPSWNGMIRTTCVPTMISGGHADNALPQRVTVNVNCRILPGTGNDEIQKTLTQVMDDPGISIKIVDGSPSRPKLPPITDRILNPANQIAEEIWPGIVVLPTLSTGATDGSYLNSASTPTYGLSGMLAGPEGNNAHGLNEHIRKQSLLDGRRFLYEVVKLYAAQ
ncbi:peptidase M20 [Acetobacter sp. DsW_063]|nr:peptidase M20 [Acetobacter sp. DsW_063]